MINLFYNYYSDRSEERAQEIRSCLEKNVSNPNFDNIILLNESTEEFHSPRVISLAVPSRPLFKDIFTTVSEYSKDDDINIIMNSDCFLDINDTSTLRKIGRNEAWCILRTEVTSAGPLKLNKRLNKRNRRKHSSDMQDGWVFVGKPKTGMGLDFYMGTPGCDNRLAYEFQNAGYTIANPGAFLKLYHLHNTKTRTYSEKERVPGPYAFPELM